MCCVGCNTGHPTMCSVGIVLAWFSYRVSQVYTKSGRLVAPPTKFLTVSPNLFTIILASFTQIIKCVSHYMHKYKEPDHSEVNRSLQNYRSLVWGLLCVTHVTPRIQRWLLDFRQTYGTLECQNSRRLFSMYWRYVKRMGCKTCQILTVR